MTELQKLKYDRDVCYMLACKTYGRAFVNALLYEGDEDDVEQSTEVSVPATSEDNGELVYITPNGGTSNE